MNVITPEQSDKIAEEIRAQAEIVNALSDLFAPPWGALGRYRMTRLYRERLTAAERQT